ncbi:hypothetical protein BJ684DRAFT_16878 [Piptocephalis cylindrospora]|uniref:Uncharacterized protein n=1 Tax=Piptocephalis cylindrospora TaxID=1907219 RepID=A0A4P9Y1H9_9FUNG|nr:hypothetical protein BJ684DRAFT_16878 [Piptocephalis cylindrospora]|eukprot:RKP12658.1 hypothetical protein BJ684DRAFT_16878 [Piptocephalis cylindrospora]
MNRQRALGILGGLVGLASLGFGIWTAYSMWSGQGPPSQSARRGSRRRVVTIDVNGLLLRVSPLEVGSWTLETLPGAKEWLEKMMDQATIYLIVHLPPSSIEEGKVKDMNRVREHCQWVEREAQRVLGVTLRQEDTVLATSTVQGRVHLIRALQPNLHLDSDDTVIGQVRFFVGRAHHLTSLEDPSVWDAM